MTFGTNMYVLPMVLAHWFINANLQNNADTLWQSYVENI